jgi:hypothetical protein
MSESIEDIINSNLIRGWINLTETYTHSVAKERSSDPYIYDKVNEKLLKMLGAVREYYIDYLFHSVLSEIKTKRRNTYQSFGSTNITSDYDITINGPDAPVIIENIFFLFLKQYPKSLPFGFDTNLYCMGYFSPDASKYYCDKISGSDISILKCDGRPEQIINVMYACLKICDILPKSEFKQQIITLKQKLDYQLDDVSRQCQYQLDDLQVPRVRCDDESTVIAKYTLYIKNSKKFHKILYGKTRSTSMEELHELSCISNYYAMESYYTSPTVKTVVLKMQGEKDIDLQDIDCVCSSIENFGDFIHHSGILNSSSRNEEFIHALLKTSKYIHRMCYALLHLEIGGEECKRLNYYVEEIADKKKDKTLTVELFKKSKFYTTYFGNKTDKTELINMFLTWNLDAMEPFLN